MIYAGKVFRSSIAGSRVKDVVCEQCGSTYHYQMVRRGEGSSSAPYYLGQRSARERSEKAARKSLDKRLTSGVDAVPCVKCGWFQKNMVHDLRRRRLRWLLWCGWILGGLGFLIYGLSLMIAMNDHGVHLRASDQAFFISAGFVVAIITASIFGLRWLLLKSINPNRAFPERSTPIPGMPRGYDDESVSVILEDESAVRFEDQNTLQYERRQPLVSDGGWVTVQLLKIRYPRLCCSCLQPTETMHPYSLVSDTDKVPVRICDACRKRSKFNVVGVSVGTGLIAGLVVALKAYFSTDVAADRLLMAIVMAIAASICIGALTYFLFGRFLQAVRFSQFSPTYYTIRLRFRNRQYTALFADENQLN